jgi:hypothetical protein
LIFLPRKSLDAGYTGEGYGAAMFVFYEHFVGSIPAEDVWEFCLSSDGKTNRITFVDKNEKARHALLLEFFKNIPLDVRTYDASNYISCIIGTA